MSKCEYIKKIYNLTNEYTLSQLFSRNIKMLDCILKRLEKEKELKNE